MIFFALKGIKVIFSTTKYIIAAKEFYWKNNVLTKDGHVNLYSCRLFTKVLCVMDAYTYYYHILVHVGSSWFHSPSDWQVIRACPTRVDPLTQENCTTEPASPASPYTIAE